MRHYLKKLSVLLCAGITAIAAAEPGSLTCDYRIDPVGVEKKSPGLSWQMESAQSGTMQSAYQIQVASSAEQLIQDLADLWDSGRVASGVSLQIPYAGKQLASRQVCYWRVRIWQEGETNPGDWSAPAKWEMGLLNPADWSARWIQSVSNPPVPLTDALKVWMFATAQDKGKAARRPIEWKPGIDMPENAKRLEALEPATWLRKDFTIGKKVVRARLYSTAAGYADFYLDGKKLGSRLRNPAQTDFEKRILYDIDVLDDALTTGTHQLTVHLGQGFFGQNAGFSSDKFYYGRPAIIAQLELTYADGSKETIASDSSWESRPSAVVKNNVYAGEVFDGMQTSKDWKPVQTLEKSPTERLEVQTLPTVQEVKRIAPVKLLNPEPGVWVYDFGQNFTGVVEMDCSRLELEPGKAVYLRYAEWADDSGTTGMDSGGGFATKVNQTDAYMAGPKSSKVWKPSFTWHGFRYVEVTGLKKKPDLGLLTGCLMRSAVPTVGTFESSSEHLNRVHRTALWTYESNLISIPSDCPIRERCGWTGDAHAALTLSNYNYDMALFWEKYLGDFRTNKEIAPAIVPGKRGGGNSPDWAVAQVLIADEQYRFHGDLDAVKAHYKNLLAFMDYGRGLQKNGIISIKYGDWCDPVRKPGDARVGGAGRPQQTPKEKTSTALFIKACAVMVELADVVGDQKQVAIFSDWKQETAADFHDAFFDETAGSYGSQTADAMALCFDIVPEQLRETVAKSLNRDVLENWNGHASVGALGHRWLYPALADHGYADTALGTFFAQGHPGFYYLFNELNGTSLWERKGAFNPATMEQPVRSLSHPFQGGYDAWFYLGLGGIRPSSEQPGFKQIILRPVFPESLDWVKVGYESEYGEISSHWKRADNKIQWTVETPPNTSSLLVLDIQGLESVEIDGSAVPLRELSAYPLDNGVHTINLTLKQD
ncbi:family 78 glycoside hydrolase catalytic domain [Pontiellaceae bacterium B12227]|nr:family 78 glycoside hydrolase catalytic domain [Pontiellaceae bacterium B12227]